MKKFELHIEQRAALSVLCDIAETCSEPATVRMQVYVDDELDDEVLMCGPHAFACAAGTLPGMFVELLGDA